MNDDCWATNTNLTTPLCWSKHASLLSKYIDTETVASVSRWTVQQVVDFLVKFGTAAKELDHFREEVSYFLRSFSMTYRLEYKYRPLTYQPFAVPSISPLNI